MQVKRCPSLDQLHWSKSELIKKYQPFVSKCFHEIMLNYVVLSLTNARSLAMAIPKNVYISAFFCKKTIHISANRFPGHALM